MRRLLILLSTLGFVFALPGVALGYWLATDSAGSARAVAAVLPAGLAPNVVANTGHSVTLEVPAVTPPVAGYLVRRYSVGGQLASSFGCPGRCAESGVPDGTWVYTDLPLLGSWRGRESPPSAPLRLDTTAPVPTVSSPVTATNHRTPQLSGTAGTADGDAGRVTVRLLTGSRLLLLRTVAVRAGRWQLSAGRLSPQRSYVVLVRQLDAAGNLGQARAGFVLDTVAPSVSLSPVHWPVFSGRAGNAHATRTTSADSSAVDVQIFAAGHRVRTLTATRTGTHWTVTGTGLPSGDYTARASQRDAAGNVSYSSVGRFTIDGVPPAVTVSVPASLNTVTPTVSGRAGTADGDQAGLQLQVLADGIVVQRLTVATAGSSWSAQLRALAPNRRYQVRVRQADRAGNVGRATASFVLDTVPPVLSAGYAAGVLSGSAGTTPAGTAPSGLSTSADAKTVQVLVFSRQQVQATLTRPVLNGGFSTTLPSLPPGDYTVVVQQLDQAGNVGRSAPVDVVIPPAG